MSTATEQIRAALAAGPTPGPWMQEHRMGFEGLWNTEVFDQTGEAIAQLMWYPKPMGAGVTTTSRAENAAFIAACNPVAIAGLLSERDALAQRLEAAEKDAGRFQFIEASGHSGTIRLDDELGVCPRYINWGGATGLHLSAAIDQALSTGGREG